jgi:hypothetical protein
MLRRSSTRDSNHRCADRYWTLVPLWTPTGKVDDPRAMRGIRVASVDPYVGRISHFYRRLFIARQKDNVATTLKQVRRQLGLGSAFGIWDARARYKYCSAVQLGPIRGLQPIAMLAGPLHQRGMSTVCRLCRSRPNRQCTECEEADESPTHDSSPAAQHSHYPLGRLRFHVLVRTLHGDLDGTAARSPVLVESA